MPEVQNSKDRLKEITASIEDGIKDLFQSDKAEREGISYEEAEQIVDAAIASALENLPASVSPMSWVGDETVPNGDSTYTIYGQVTGVHNSIMNMSALYGTQAVKLYHHYGSYWIDVTSSGYAYANTSGAYEFVSGQVTGTILQGDNTKLRLTLAGYFQVESSVAINAGYSSASFDVSVTIGTTVYFRDNIYTTMIEIA